MNQNLFHCYYKKYMLKYSKILLYFIIYRKKLRLLWNHQVILASFPIGILFYTNNEGTYI